MRTYTSDFETTTDPDDCRVWAFACCTVDGRHEVTYGSSIEGFMEWCESQAPCKTYFHNLAFDGSFLMTWLLTHGWAWVDDRRKATDMTFTALISDMNQVYNITLYFTKVMKVIIYDSLKVLPMSIEQMAKAFDLPIGKGTLDYGAYREPGHELTDEEKEYIAGDVTIAAMAVGQALDEGLTRMTAGSNALYRYKKMGGGSKGFRRVYPVLDEDEDAFIRKAYRGGFTYADPRFKGKRLGAGIVLDVNSLYPSVLAATDGQLLPYGKPIWFDGAYEEDERHPLWVASVSCKLKLKEGRIPCLQIKGNWRFGATEYITDTHGEVTICVTNVDWALIREQYDVRAVEFNGGFKFKANTSQFKSYVDEWMKVKEEATLTGNKGKRHLAKLMLNSLYGKFATRTEVVSRKPVIDEESGVLRYVDLPPETREPVYLPVGVFVTAHARAKTIRAAQSQYPRFLYSDTDSLHLLGTDMPEGLEVDDVKLGAWAHESTFTEAKFLRAKCYAEQEVGADALTVHVAGMPKRCHEGVTLDNFEFGAKYSGKLYTHRVKGGIVLVEGDMEIRK